MTGEFYVSVDVEADGPIPGDCNMVSVGASVCGTRLHMDDYHFRGANDATFYRELRAEFPGTARTREWLAGQGFEVNGPQAIDPKAAMRHFKEWVEGQARRLDARPVYVAYPLSFDWSFTHWYFEHYLGTKSDPFGFSNALDIKTAFCIKSDHLLLKSTKKRMPAAVKKIATAHTHNALDDAIGQGELFVNLMEWRP